MKSFFDEFKKFALRGNVIDLAIGVVIGTAFNNVTNSLVNNILTPPLGLLMGKINFVDLAILLPGTVKIQYGLFIQAIISFIITAFALFVLVRALNRLEKIARRDEQNDPPPPPPPPSMKTPELVTLEEIRDLLKGAPQSQP